MRRSVGKVASNSMVRLCVIYAFTLFTAITATGFHNKYCNLNCEFDEHLTFVHTVCEREKEVGDGIFYTL